VQAPNKKTQYGRANLPQVLTQGTDTTITYVFDVNDMRIGKQVDKAGTVVTKDYYLRDAAGKELAIINQAKEIDWNVYGIQRVAQFRHELPLDAGVQLNVKVLLEGPTDALGVMSTELNDTRRVLPGMTLTGQTTPATPAGQPYNTAPWNYDGSEGSTFTNADYAPTVVDWVLLSLRTDLTKDTEIFKTAALLHKDGQIELLNATRLPNDLPPVYVVIEHRNHMGAISPQPVTIVNGMLTYDFTAENSFRGIGAGQKQHPTSGLWMLYAGNATNDLTGYDINGGDQTVWNQQNGLFSQYLPSDYNMDGEVTGQDKTVWVRNNGIVFTNAAV